MQIHMNRTGVFIYLFAACFLMVGAGCCSHPGVCIVRVEVGGYMNVVPVGVSVDGKKVATLVAESLLTIPVEPGSHVVCLEYYNPYRDREVLKSRNFSVIALEGNLQKFVLDPVCENGAYAGDWALVSEKQARKNSAEATEAR